MNVASQELCWELYELSAWAETDLQWRFSYESKTSTRKGMTWHVARPHKGGLPPIPAYDLGYLLRKLPLDSEGETPGVYWDQLENAWAADYGNEMRYRQHAANPEDATAKLAIELFKQGILKRT